MARLLLYNPEAAGLACHVLELVVLNFQQSGSGASSVDMELRGSLGR